MADHVLHDSRLLNAAFAHARPFKHVIIDDFLQPEVAERLLATFPSVSEPSTLLNEFGAPNPKSQISAVAGIGGVYAAMDDYVQSEGFLRLMSQITGIADLRYDPWYFGAGTHENFHGAGLDAHFDFNIHPVTGQHRRINAIIYLNKDWSADWGGSLALHRDPWDLVGDEKIEIAPAFNRCVIFETTERSWHSVPPVNLPAAQRDLSRKSFTLYLYTDERPAEETAPEHATIYVQPPLSPHIAAGRTLTEEDMAEISGNISRRHTFLRSLYQREYRFSETIAQLRTTVAELKRNVQVPLVGYGKVAEVQFPLFPDGWMGEALSFRVRPLRPVCGLRLTAWFSESTPAGAHLTLKAAGAETCKAAAPGFVTLDVTFKNALHDAFDVEVTSDRVFTAGNGDGRQVSTILDTIELLHDALPAQAGSAR